MTDFQKKEYVLPPLSYDLGDLEPFISQEIMTLHYTKHHQAYINNLNKAMEQLEKAEKEGNLTTVTQLLSAIKFNGGGHLNHSIFWTNLAPKEQGGGTPPTGPLANAIINTFGSLQKLIEQLSALAIGLQGSGWAWLAYEKQNDRLVLTTCDNQDPVSSKGLVPLLGIDVWEHAYYLQYKNVRADYVKAIWEVVSWNNVSERFISARSM